MEDTNSGLITEHIQIFPVRPLGMMDENLIGQYSMQQNCFTAALESYTLKGYRNIDDKVTLKDGCTQTLRDLVLYYLFEMR